MITARSPHGHRRRGSATLLTAGLLVGPLALTIGGCGLLPSRTSNATAAATAAAATSPATVSTTATPRAPSPTSPAAKATSGKTSSESATSSAAAGKLGLPDPCALVDKKLADSLVRLTLLPAEVTPDSCVYDPNGPVAQVSVYVGDSAKNYYDVDKAIGHTFTKLDGVAADEAWLEDYAVFLRKGSVWVTVSTVSRVDAPPNLVPLSEAAKQVAAKL